MAKVKAAVITDVHYGFDFRDKLGSKAPRLMDYFIKAVNKYGPDLIVDMGDRVSSKDKASDTQYMQQYCDHFNKAAAPAYFIPGNHDIRFLSRDENAAITGGPAVSESIDVGGAHMVFWKPEYVFGEDGIELRPEDIDWLKDDLEQAKGKPAFVFSHVPLDNESGEELGTITKYYFWTQGEKVREIMEQAGNVVLCMAGHRHNNRHKEINGIHYVTQQSFTNQWKEHYRVPARAWSKLEYDADNDNLTVKLEGKFQKTYNLTPRPVPAP